MEYLIKALSVWLTAFLPVSELFVAIPAGFALGLNAPSVWLWTVVGNFMPILLIQLLYEQLMGCRPIGRWLSRLATDKVQARANKYGIWFVLLATPLTGVWAMAITARLLAMEAGRVRLFALLSICIYALGVTLGVFCGAGALLNI